MPNLSSSLGTTQRYIPSVAPSQVGRYAGLMMVFTDLTSLNLAVADERLNITDSSPIWSNGQVVAVAGEFDGGGCVRVWNVAGQHARKVILRPGLSVTLAADTSAVLFAAGAPAAGTGANGDISIDWAGNAYYTKSAGDWFLSGVLYASGGGGVFTVAGRAGAVTLSSADVGLGNVNNTADTSKPVSAAQQTALNLKADTTAVTTALAGKADLSGGKLLASQVPDLSIMQFLGTAANQAAMLALTGQRGDWCIRSDTSTVFVLSADAPTLIGSWTQLSYPASPVASVAGKTGAVTLTGSDVGLGSVNNTADSAKPVSTAQQAALDTKAPLANAALTGNPTAPTQVGTDNSTRLATTAFVKSHAASGFSPVQVTTLQGLADDVTIDGNGNPTLVARIVPRSTSQAQLDILAGTANELAYATDTKRLALMSGSVGTPHTFLGLAVGAYGADLTTKGVVVGGAEECGSNLILGRTLLTLDAGFLPCVGNIAILTGISSEEMSLTGSRSLSIGQTPSAYSDSTSIGTTSACNRSLAISYGIGSIQGKGIVAYSSSSESTSNATPTVLGTAALEELQIMNGDCDLQITVVARNTTTGAKGCYRRRVFTSSGADGSSVVIKQIETIGTDFMDSGFTPPAPTFSMSNRALLVSVTGLAATPIEWSVAVHGISV